MIVLDAALVWNTSQYVLDSDSSAEMVLAHHLYETGRFLSEDWFYSTEIRAVYTQLIFAPLFRLFASWHMVRFVGTMLLHALLLASYGYMTLKAGMNRKAFFIGGALLLLPVSVPYGRIVLYQVSYILCISFGFLMTGLLMAMLKDRRIGWRIAHAMLLAAISFASALSGVLGLFCLIYGAKLLARRELPPVNGALVMELMSPCSMVIMLAVFILTRQNVAADRYFLTCAVWLIPLLSLKITTLPDRRAEEATRWLPAWLTAQKLVLYGVCGLCLLNGLINMRSFTRPQAFGQPYTGLEYTVVDKVQRLSPVRDFLVEGGYDLGYATYWNTNVLTEMSDGQLRMICAERSPAENKLTWADWLFLKTNLTCEAQKPFILLEPSERESIVRTGLDPYVEKAYEDGHCTVYEILDLERVRELIVKRSQ